MTRYIDTLPPGDPRETVEIKGNRQKFAEVFIEHSGELIKGYMLREDGDRVTVRWDDPESPKGCVVKTVFRDKFEQWQKKAPQL